MDIKTQKMLADVVLNAQNKAVKPYTTTATVKSVNNGIVYVEIPGSDRDTPVKNSSVSVKKGDVVDLVVSHSDTHITGNRSDVAVPESTAQKMSQTLEATRLEMDNELDLFNNKIKMVNNSIEMQDNKIEMQNNTITQFGNTIDQQNNIIEQQNNNIAEIGNTVNSQGNDITEIGNKVNSQGNDITEIGNKVNSQGNDITEIGNKVNSQGNTITELDNTIVEIGNTVNSQGNKITEIGNAIELQDSTIETLDSTVKAQGSTIETLDSTIKAQGSTIGTLDSTVKTQGSTIGTLDSTVKTQGSTIATLGSNVEIINSAFVIQDGKLTGISKIVTDILDSGYVTTDLLNADVAWIENGKIKEGAIGTTEIADASITTAKIDELSADVIKTGTIRTERLILTTDEVDPETGEKKVALITALNAKVNAGEGNILNGAVIADETITAAKIDVVDLNAFNATIGNFTIGTSSIYNGKTSLKDPTNGVYIGTDGIALGQGSLLGMTDDSPFRVESDGDFHLGAKDSNYVNFDAFTGELDINAKSIKMGSKSVVSTEDVTTAIESVEVGGRNLLFDTETMKSWAKGASLSVEYNQTDYLYKNNAVKLTNTKSDGSLGSVWFKQSKFNDLANRVGKRTFSIWAKTDDPSLGGYLRLICNISTNTLNGKSFYLSTEWERYTFSYDVTEDLGNGYLDFIYLNVAGTSPIYICYPKHEIGNKATDWTPAPEDIEASVDTKLEDYATLEVTNNKISTAVTETKTYADGKASDAVSTAKSYTDQTKDGIISTVSKTYTTKTEFDNLQIGGRNLLLGSANPVNKFSWNGQNGSATITEETMLGVKGILLDITIASAGRPLCCYAFGPSRMELIKPVRYYTLSFDIYPTVDDFINFKIMDPNASNAISSYSEDKKIVAGEWNHVSLTVETFATITISEQVIFIRGINSVATYKICNFKLEEGNKATDWTPAPEDTEAEIQSVDNKLTTNLLKSTLETATWHGVTCTNNGDGTYTLNGTSNANSNFTFYKGNIPQGKLKLVGCPNNGGTGKYLMRLGKGETDTYVSFDIGDGITFDSDGGVYVIKIHFYEGQVYNNLVFKPMLTTNLNATYDDFVPYTGGTGSLNRDLANNHKLTETVKTIAEQTADKFSWLVKSGTSATNFELTDRVASLLSEKFDIDALTTFKNSAENGTSTVINGGAIDTDSLFAKAITATNMTISGDSKFGNFRANTKIEGLKYINNNFSGLINLGRINDYFDEQPYGILIGYGSSTTQLQAGGIYIESPNVDVGALTKIHGGLISTREISSSSSDLEILFSANLVPVVDGRIALSSLGTSSKKFGNLYTETINGTSINSSGKASTSYYGVTKLSSSTTSTSTSLAATSSAVKSLNDKRAYKCLYISSPTSATSISSIVQGDYKEIIVEVETYQGDMWAAYQVSVPIDAVSSLTSYKSWYVGYAVGTAYYGLADILIKKDYIFLNQVYRGGANLTNDRNTHMRVYYR